jgi:hypothetical protein
MWSIPTEIKELQEQLEKESEEFDKRRELIPKIKGTPSGDALYELLEVLSDRYFQQLVSTDPNNIARTGFYQGAYHVLAKVLNEVQGE